MSDDPVCLHDTSVILEPVELNVNDNADDYEFSFSARDALRKNLTQAFDKHVHSVTSSHSMAQAIAAAAAASKKPPLVPPHASINLTNNSSGATAAANKGMTTMSKRHLSVFLRVRPPVASNEPGTQNTVEILPPSDDNPDVSYGGLSKTIRTNPPVQSNAAKVDRGVKEFLFSGIFGPAASQQDLYNTVAAPLVQGLFPNNPTGSEQAIAEPNTSHNKAGLPSMIGQSALLFAYGITNAGKTHTILGNVQSKNQKNWGIVPKSLQDIFSRMESSPNQYDLFLSYFEIYQDQIYDLLPKKPSIRPETLKLRERGEQVVIRGLARHRLRDIPHALGMVHDAHRKRHTSSNNLNRDSSRSHCICQLELVVKQRNDTTNDDDHDDASVASTHSGYTTDDEVMMQSKRQVATLWIVDLAGIERSKRTHVVALRQKEASLINQSLMNLMRCLTLLREIPQQPQNSTRSNRIPFRESKLTHLFMNHFLQTGAARTRMIVNINPAAADYDETQHVLTYASQARKVIQLDAEATRIVRPLPPSQRHQPPASRATRSATATNAASKKWAANAGAAAKQALIQVVRKLSPKRMQAQKQQHALRKRAAPNDNRVDVNNNENICSNNENLHPPTKRIRTKEAEPIQDAAPVLATAQANYVTDLKRQIQALETALSVAQAENQVLRYEKDQLADALNQKEEQIRLEVAEEMEFQMNAMRQHYDDILQRLNLQPQQGAVMARDDDAEIVEGKVGQYDDGYYDEFGEEETEEYYDDDDDTVEAEDLEPTPKMERQQVATSTDDDN
jgi:hypothetical protein